MSSAFFKTFILAFFWVPMCEVLGQTEELIQPQSALPSGNDMLVNWVKMMGAFVAVLALFFLGVLLFRKYGNFLQPRRGEGMLQILETKALNQRNMLYVVECLGDRFLVASGQQGTPSLLPIHGSMEVSDTEADKEPATLKPDFAGVIAKALGHKK